MRENETGTVAQNNILNEIGEILAAGYFRLLEEEKKSPVKNTVKANAERKRPKKT